MGGRAATPRDDAIQPGRVLQGLLGRGWPACRPRRGRCAGSQRAAARRDARVRGVPAVRPRPGWLGLVWGFPCQGVFWCWLAASRRKGGAPGGLLLSPVRHGDAATACRWAAAPPGGGRVVRRSGSQACLLPGDVLAATDLAAMCLLRCRRWKANEPRGARHGARKLAPQTCIRLAPCGTGPRSSHALRQRGSGVAGPY